MTPDPERVKDVAGKLTKAQREALLQFDERVYSRREIHSRTWAALYRLGIAAHILAAGYIFFNWTDFGLAVRAHLQGNPTP